MAAPQSDAIKELIEKAKIMNFSAWRPGHPPESIALFQAADDEKRYLSDADLETMARLAPKKAGLMAIAQLLRDQAQDIVDEARAEVLNHFPGLTEPNGRLYPPERAEACWRDFWHFLRSITYGIAGGIPEYTSQLGLHFLEALYHELRVPLDAMVLGLENIKSASLQRLEADQKAQVAPYFDHLIRQMQHFHED